MGIVVDAMLTSASRPELLKDCITTTDKHLKRSKHSIRFFMHEDYIITKDSERCVRIASACGMFDRIIWSKPRIGFSPAMKRLLSECVASDIVLMLLDDYVFERDVDFDRIVDLMLGNSEINQIAFSKRTIGDHKYKFIKKVYEFDGVALTTNPHWVFGNGLWRMSFIRNSLKFHKKRSHWLTNVAMKQRLGFDFDETPTAEWVHENQGTYLLGPITGKRHVWHRGYNQPMAVVVGDEGAVNDENREFVETARAKIRREGGR